MTNPPRVSLIEGTALYESADDVEITELAINLPLLTGDRIYGIDDARIEIQQGPGNLVRIAGNTDLKWLGTDDVLRIELTAGDLILRVTDIASHKVFTPFASVRLETPGLYRVSVDVEGRLVLTVREGVAEVANRLRVREVSAGEQILVDQPQSGLTQVSLVQTLDAFDQWSENRDQIFQQAASADYLDPSYTAGVAELDQYGEWEYVNDYGQVWFPQVSVDFAPYRAGRWAHYPRWGWTWISHEPWGWLPYHHGQWVYYQPSSRWCWVPGRSGWSGSLVDFYYGGGYVGWAPRGHRGWGQSRRYGSGFSLAVGTPGFSFVLRTDFRRPRVDRRLRNNAANNVRVFREGLPRDVREPRNRGRENVVTVGRNRGGGNQGDGNNRNRSAVTEARRQADRSNRATTSRTGLEGWQGRDRNRQEPGVGQASGARANPASPAQPSWTTTRQRQRSGSAQTVQPNQTPRSTRSQEGQVRSRTTPTQNRGSTSGVIRSRSGSTPQVTGSSPTRSSGSRSPSRPSVTRSAPRPSVTRSPTRPSVTRSPARPSVTRSPARSSVTRSPARPSVTRSPARPSVTRSPARSSVTRSPSRPSVTRSTARPSVTRSPSRPSVTRSTARPSVTRSPSRPSVTRARPSAPQRSRTNPSQRPPRKPPQELP